LNRQWKTVKFPIQRKTHNKYQEQDVKEKKITQDQQKKKENKKIAY
jgi:hypothetical protein